MKTKFLNWITLLPLAVFVVLFTMAVKSQHATDSSQSQSQKSVTSLLPDSTQTKLYDKSKVMSRVDSLAREDSLLSLSNAREIKKAVAKKERFEKFKENRKIVQVNQLPAPTSLITNPPSLPDSVVIKKKPKRSVLNRIFNRNR